MLNVQVRWMKLTGCVTNLRDWRLPFQPWLVQQGQWAPRGVAVGLDPNFQHSLANNPQGTDMKSEILTSNSIFAAESPCMFFLVSSN